MSRTIRVAALFVAAAVVTGRGSQSPPASPSSSWPPGLRQVAADSPPRSPADEMKTFFMPPGYHVELVASEPLIQDPVLIDWDPDGRLWAIEMPGYMHDARASDEHGPTGRIVVLEDTDGDGRMDKRTVFADGLILPRALKVLAHGVLVGEPPHLWLMRDTDGDLKADTKESVTDQYGRLDATVEHNANSLLWALDNWMYTSEVDIYLRLRHDKFEVRKTLSRGQWGATQDDAGRVYRNTNESVLHVDVVPTPYYARNPNLLRTRGSYESLEGEHREVDTVWPVRPTRGVNRGYQTGVLRADGSLAAYTSVSSPLVYRGDRLPHELYGNVFVTEPAGNLVSRIIVEDDGAGLRARKAYDHAEFLASTDERFRPVYLSNAPDGTLYIVDLYRGIIQHRDYITEYLRDQILSRQLEQPTGLGRIYRVVHDTTRRGPVPRLAKAPAADLVAALSHPNGWWRDTAQRLLVERNDSSVVPALRELAGDADPRVRLHALWTLDGLDSLTAPLEIQALDDRSRDVRVSAVRLAERFVEYYPEIAVQQALVRRIDDQDWAVRDQLAASLGALPLGARVPAIALLLARHGDDPITLDAAISGVSGHEADVIDRLMSSAGGPTPMVQDALTMLAATVTRGGDDGQVSRMFGWAGDGARPEWARDALVRGTEVALLGAPMPGSPARAGGGPAPAAPCPTCPGARGGPGGGYAFRPAAPAGRGGRGSGGPVLRLEAEPKALVALAADKGPLGARAAKVLERVVWPGKPGAPAAATPLNASERALFDAGEQTYKSLCQACHQPDGRGQERVGANLVGSALVLGAPEIAARIVLNGKEGTIGLMPPLGTGLSDEQIAGALTYIRHEWGNAASAVTPAVVGQVRAQTAGRTRPWTDAELGIK